MFMIRRKSVRVHQAGDVPTVEGILVGKPWRNSGHYVVRKAGLIASPGQTIPVEGKEMWVPREKVVFVEVLR